MDKKAQVGGLQGFILSIVTVAVILAIGLIVMNEMKDAAKVMYTTSVTNESVTVTSGFGALSQGGELFVSVSTCINATNNSNLIDTTACNISSLGTVSVDTLNFSSGSAVYVNYSHYTPNAAYNSSKTIITKLATVPTWIGIIIIVALAFIVLSFFIGKRQ